VPHYCIRLLFTNSALVDIRAALLHPAPLLVPVSLAPCPSFPLALGGTRKPRLGPPCS
jgi:hypothetical protein